MGQVSPRCSWAKGTQREVHAPLLLHLDLAGLVSAPHGLDEAPVLAWRALASSREWAAKMWSSRFSWPAGTGRRGWHPGCGDGGLQLVREIKTFSPLVPADQDALVLLHVLGANLHPQGDALHLVLGGLPAHGLVGGVHLGPQAGGLQRSSRAVAASRTPSLCWATGMTITWVGAMRGGRTRPLLSPWVMMRPPIIRVETPQEVWWG